MKNLTPEEFNLLLCSTGFLPPPETKMSTYFFEEMHESYNVQTKNRHVDIDAIINGNCILSNPEDQIIESAPMFLRQALMYLDFLWLLEISISCHKK